MSDRVLLDTCVLIQLEKLDLGDFVQSEPLVSAISIAELAFGLDTADPVQRHARTERFYAIVNRFEIVSFGVAAAKAYGTLATLVRQHGRNPRPRRLDLQIAATAAASSVPMLTTNPADFEGLDQVVKVIAV